MSLIEALIAGGVLATGVLGLAQVLVFSATAIASARQMTMATWLAAQKVEELRAAAFEAGGGADQVEQYRRTWQVSWHPDDPADTLAIVVTVTPGGARFATRRTRRAP
jgi:Tfp pilus assembly protein PilV